MRSHEHDPVYRITSASRSLDADVRGRQRRYVISMAVRTACFVLAIVTSGWLRWTFVAGAVLLPYFAVVMANAGQSPEPDLPFVQPGEQRPQLGAGTDPGARPGM